MALQHIKPIQKIFIRDNSRASLLCPVCSFSKEVNVSKYKNIDTSVVLKVKCRCGKTYPVTLERRKFYRKDINLPGEFKSHPPKGHSQKGRMTVINISKGGLKFRLLTRPLFNKGDILEIEFQMDNQNRTLVKKEVLVRNIKGLSVNVEFCDYNPVDPGDRAIAFYLF